MNVSDTRAAAWADLIDIGQAVGRQENSEEWLLRCLKRNAHTEFGRKYGFANINTVAAYQEAVPLRTYEELFCMVQRVAAGEPDLLFSGLPVAFEQTSGTGGSAKMIPYSQESLADFQQVLLPWLANLAVKYHLGGSLYWSISPAMRREIRTSGGISLGLGDAGYIGAEAGIAIASLTAVPFSVGEVEDLATWRLLTLYYLVRAADLCFVSLWSPTFFSVLLDALPECAGELKILFGQGGILAGHVLKSDEKAAKRLEFYLERQDTSLLWPHLALLSVWADSSAAAPALALQKQLPQVAFQGKGLLSTEGMVTVPDDNGQAFVIEGNGFREFLNSEGQCVLPEDLVPGQRYQTVLTTAGGLYRYKSGDVIMCTGYAGGRAVVKFCGREGLVSDLAGEKLTDAFVELCLQNVPGFRMLVPSVKKPLGYWLVQESGCVAPLDMVRQVETALCANPQYAYARKLGQLRSVKVLEVPDAEKRYFSWAGHKGQGAIGARKIPSLVLHMAWFMD